MFYVAWPSVGAPLSVVMFLSPDLRQRKVPATDKRHGRAQSRQGRRVIGQKNLVATDINEFALALGVRAPEHENNVSLMLTNMPDHGTR